MAEPNDNIWNQLPSQPQNIAKIKIGTAVAALILGIVSIAMAMFITGAIFGFVGVILAITCFAGKSTGKPMAGWGLALSVVGILISCCFALIYYGAFLHRHDALYGYEGDSARKGPLDYWIGKKSPALTLTDVEGNEIKLSQLKGKRVVLNLWVTWELRSRDAIPHLINLRNNASEEEVVIIGISRATKEEVRGIGRQLGINYPLVSSRDLPAPFGWESSLPTTFFIDRNGVIRNIMERYHDPEKLTSYALEPEPKQSPPQDSNTITSAPVE